MKPEKAMHAVRDAYCKDDFWFEPGAKNYRGEFNWWLHIESDAPSYCVAPWPFADAIIGNTCGGDGFMKVAAETLMAHYHIHQFRNWPGLWFQLPQHMREAICALPIGQRHKYRFWWGLFRTPLRSQLLHNPECAIPKEFIDALTRPNKASR